MKPPILIVISLAVGANLVACSDGDTGSSLDTPPNPPENVTVTPVYEGSKITWTDASDDETGFVIYRENLVEPTGTVVLQAGDEVGRVGENVETFLDETVDEGASYRYLVAALGGDGTSESEGNSSEPITPIPEAAESAFTWLDAWSSSSPTEVTPGGTLRLNAVGPDTFNPLASRQADPMLDILFNEGAALLKRGPDSEIWLPHAAESFTVSGDGRTVDFVLRDDLYWSDGEPVTPQDYYFRFQAETDTEVMGDVLNWPPGTELQITGDESLRFVFDPVTRASLPLMAMVPLPDHILGEIYRVEGAEAMREAWGTDVDLTTTAWTSPWVPMSFEDDESATLVRNPYFGSWNRDASGARLPYLDEIHFVLTPDGTDYFLDGSIDLASPAGHQVEQVTSSGLDVTLLEDVGPVASNNFMFFNWNKSSNPFKEDLFRNSQFRQAMSHLMDRNRIVQDVFGGRADPQWSSVYRAESFWLNESVPKFPYEPDAAAALLDGLGFTEENDQGFREDTAGNELEFNLATNAGNPAREAIATIFADSAATAGVNVEVEFIDFSLMVDLVLGSGSDRPFDAILIGLSGGNRDWPFDPQLVSCSGDLHMWNRDAGCLFDWESDIEDLFQDGLVSLDVDDAKVIGDDIQELEAEHQARIFTVSPLASYAWRSYVQGEHPEELINPVLGSRQLPLTWVTSP